MADASWPSLDQFNQRETTRRCDRFTDVARCRECGQCLAHFHSIARLNFIGREQTEIAAGVARGLVDGMPLREGPEVRVSLSARDSFVVDLPSRAGAIPGAFRPIPWQGVSRRESPPAFALAA